MHAVVQALMLDNPQPFPVDYEWCLSSPVFSVTPATDTIKPRSTCQVAVKWVPGAAAGRAGAGAKQLAAAAHTQAERPAVATGPQKAAAAAPSGQTAGASSPARKLSKTGSQGASSTAAAAAPGSRPLSKQASGKKPGAPSAEATPRSKASQAAAGAAASDSSTASGPIPTNSNSSITVELPAESAAPAPAAASAVGCQHTGYMTLKLKGGGDVPPKKVLLYGELPASMIKFAAKELNLGHVPLFEQQAAMVQLKNVGSTDAAFRVRRLVQV